MTKKEELSKADAQVVKEEASAEVVYQAEVKADAVDAEDARLACLPVQTRSVRKSQKEQA